MEDLFDMVKKAIVPLKTADIQYSALDFLPVRYRYSQRLLSPAEPQQYLRLAGGGRIEKAAPFSVLIHPFEGFFLLFSLRGGGRLRQDQSVLAVKDGDILICCSSVPCLLQSTLLPWAFCLYFAAGPGLSCFSPFLEHFYQTTKAASPVMASSIEKLRELPETVNARSLLDMHRLLTEILSEASLASLPERRLNEKDVPFYLRDMHAFIHDCRNRSFSLSDLESRYEISRYRLCREYGAAFHISPLKDFNHVRMDEAKKLLLNTDLQVQEISSRVGYENVNHFIHLFKKETGMTPGAFRSGAAQKDAGSPPADFHT